MLHVETLINYFYYIQSIEITEKILIKYNVYLKRLDSTCKYITKIVSEYDQEIPQTQTAEKP